MTKPQTYYSCSPYDERFTHTDLDEAVEEHLDSCYHHQHRCLD